MIKRSLDKIGAVLAWKPPKLIGWTAVLLVSIAMFHFLANRAVYFPMKYSDGEWPAQPWLGAQDVWLTTSDGVRIHAWWIAPPRFTVVTLYLHGNAGNITHRYGHARQIVAAGSALLLLDYRGYGKSAGSPSEAGLYKDAAAAWDYLRAQGHGAASIVLHGESLGTAVAVDLAARVPCAGVVLEAPFTSAGAVAARILPVVGPLVIRSFDSKSKISRMRAPLLIIHGDRDEVVPYALGQELFAAAPEPKSLWRIPHAGHNDIVETAGALYPQRLREFYASLPAGHGVEPPKNQ